MQGEYYSGGPSLSHCLHLHLFFPQVSSLLSLFFMLHLLFNLQCSLIFAFPRFPCPSLHFYPAPFFSLLLSSMLLILTSSSLTRRTAPSKCAPARTSVTIRCDKFKPRPKLTVIHEAQKPPSDPSHGHTQHLRPVARTHNARGW